MGSSSSTTKGSNYLPKALVDLPKPPKPTIAYILPLPASLRPKPPRP